MKVLLFIRPNFVTLYQTKNAQLLLISIFCERSRQTGPYTRPIFYDYLDPIPDQFSMITRPYTRPNGLKTIPFPAAHARIASIWEYPLPRGHYVVFLISEKDALYM